MCKTSKTSKESTRFLGVTESLWDKTQRTMLYPGAPLVSSHLTSTLCLWPQPTNLALANCGEE